jgi:hypothetical protein
MGVKIKRQENNNISDSKERSKASCPYIKVDKKV